MTHEETTLLLAAFNWADEHGIAFTSWNDEKGRGYAAYSPLGLRIAVAENWHDLLIAAVEAAKEKG